MHNRNERGLALSSRNRRLSEAGVLKASAFNRILNTAESPEKAKRLLAEAGFEVEYVEDDGERRLGAVVLEGVRLIDNVGLELAPDRIAGSPSRPYLHDRRAPPGPCT